MPLGIKHNVDQVFDDLTSAFNVVTDVALPRSLNELQDQAETVGLREIASQYEVSATVMRKYVSLTRATSSDLECTITVKGAGFPLYALKPRATKAGVSVSIKGRRITVPGTFLATMKSGHVGIFARGAYGGKSGRSLRQTGSFGRFVFGRGQRVKRPNKWGNTELPINELFTFGPAEAFGNVDVTAVMQDRVSDQASKVIARNIRFVARA